MDLSHLCVGCMEDKGNASVCPVCGWKEGRVPETPVQLPPRTILNDQYLLGRVLGQGGFGITYLAWDMNLERKIAIKEYFPHPLASRGTNRSTISIYSDIRKGEFAYGLSRFLEEGKTLAKFQEHPGIVSVIAFFKANETGYLVMEYVDGITLKEYLARNGGKIPFETALKILMPVMDALREIHGTGLLHRDISPDNIYITEKGQVKLLDFGAARYETSEYSRSLSVILKDGYAPEEQYRTRGNQGPWTDLYALAATFYYSITGKVPSQALDRLAGDDLQPPRRLGVEIPGTAETTLIKALEVRADNRYKSIEEFQTAITRPGVQIDTGEKKEGPEPGLVKTKVVRCPKCLAGNEVPLDKPLEEVSCRNCGRPMAEPKKEPAPVQKKERIEIDLSSPRVVRCPGCLTSHDIFLDKPLEKLSCKNCGYSLEKAAKDKLEAEQEKDIVDYKGVKGWLLFFCISLTMIGPLFTIYNLAVISENLERISYFSSRLKGVLQFDMFLAVGMMIFSITAGVFLWSRRKNAVIIAKRFLVTLLIFGFGESFILPVLGGISPTGDSIVSMLQVIIYFSIWFSYLKKSKRVKATYGDGDDVSY